MEKYNIIEKRDWYTANRDAAFKGKCERIIRTNLSLKDAQKELLNLFNYYFQNEYFATNWGMAVIMTRKRVFSASPTYPDDTRSFEYDGKKFYIEKELPHTEIIFINQQFKLKNYGKKEKN